MSGGQCDFCPRPGRFVRCACAHEHIVGVWVCDKKHADFLSTGEIACRICNGNFEDRKVTGYMGQGHWCELRSVEDLHERWPGPVSRLDAGRESCTHSWRTCPVHGTGTDEMPSFRTVITCIYGGAPLKDGGTWDEDTSDEVTERIAQRLERFVETGGAEKVGKAIAAALEVRKENDRRRKAEP